MIWKVLIKFSGSHSYKSVLALWSFKFRFQNSKNDKVKLIIQISQENILLLSV